MIQFLAYVILSQKKDIFFAIYRIINWMSIFSHKNLWAFKTLNAYQKVSCVWMLCRLFECILIKKWVLVGEYQENHIEDQIQDKQMQTMFQKLHIDNLDFTTLHTLIFFEDAANCKLFNRSTNYFNQLFTRLAHVQCSVFIAVQFWKSLPTEIKSNAGTVFIFPNFSKEQLRYILRQVPLPEEFERIYEKYQQLRDQQKLIVDINNQQLFIE